MRQASPHTLTAWAYTSRANGVGQRSEGRWSSSGHDTPRPSSRNSRPGSGRSGRVNPGSRHWHHDRRARQPVHCSVAASTSPSALEPNPSRLRVGVRYLNRELSWLDFNAARARARRGPDVPLLERAKFLAIFSQNLDEFFQVRVVGPAGAVRRRAPHPLPRRPRPRSSSSARSGRGSTSSSTAQAAVVHQGGRARARGRRHPLRRLGRAGRRRPRLPRRAVREPRSSRCSRRSRSTPPTRSRTSRTCR